MPSFDPEKALMAKQEKEEGELSDSESSLWKKIREDSENDKLDMDSFRDIYGKNEIDKDKRKVASLEANFDRTIKGLSELMERTLVKEINEADWFGGGSRAVNTADHDDYLNHSDLVVEWPEEDGSTTKLALDTSVTNKEDVMSRKAEKIMDELSQKKGTTIKYFQSRFTQEKGRINNVPSAVLALDRESLDNLSQFLVSSEQEDIEKSTLSTDMMACVYDQMEAQIKILEEKKATGSEIYKNLKKVSDKIFAITEKESSLRNKEPEDEVNLAELEFRLS